MNQTPAGVNSADVRAWAVANGWPQLEGKNGRLPRHAIESYLTAHGVAPEVVPPAPEPVPSPEPEGAPC